MITLIAILLFAGVEAADTLGFEALAGVIGSFTALAGRILLGLLIFAAGMYLADLAASAVRRTNRTDAQVMAAAARVSILVLTGAMALREMGLADSVINLAFGLTLGAIAVAVALAYGLGGRDIAREHLQELRQGVSDPPPGI